MTNGHNDNEPSKELVPVPRPAEDDEFIDPFEEGGLASVSAIKNAIAAVAFIGFVVAAIIVVMIISRPNVDDAAIAITEEAVDLPSAADLFGERLTPFGNDYEDCAQGRVDLLRADQEELMSVRGLREAETADLVVRGRDRLTSVPDLLRIGVDFAQVGRILLSHQTCIGPVNPDDSLPTRNCRPGDINLNEADEEEIGTIPGITPFQAVVLVGSQPYSEIGEISAIPEMPEPAITWIALGRTCFGGEDPIEFEELATDSGEILATAPCGAGRVDLLTATTDELAAVRGLRQPEVAQLIVDNRDDIETVSDLTDLGIDPQLIGRMLGAYDACIGEHRPDDELPSLVCAPGDLDLNGATVAELIALEGITPNQADLLIAERPFSTSAQIARIEGQEDQVLTALTQADLCLVLAPVAPASAGCPAGRVDLLSAGEDELSTVRGLRDPAIAELLLGDRGQVQSIADLLDISFDHDRVGRLLQSRQACLGDLNLDAELPAVTCAPDELNLNTATVAEMAALDGITPSIADLLISERPYFTDRQLFAVEGLELSVITFLSLQRTCIGPLS